MNKTLLDRNRRIFGALIVSSLLALSTSTVHAGFCGDDVDGARVPCDCGDVVAGDVTLRPDDPIALHRCPSDGLIVRANVLAESVVIDLGGIAIVGNHRGTGLLIERGGSDGAVIVGGAEGRSAEIVGFATGVHCSASSALSRLERIHVKGSLNDGFRLRQAGALLVDLSSTENGGDGFRIGGTGGRMLGAVASKNRGVGIRTFSPDLIVEAVAEDNANHGIVSRGRRSDLSGVSATGNGRTGLVARSTRQTTQGAIAAGNARSDMRIETPEATR